MNSIPRSEKHGQETENLKGSSCLENRGRAVKETSYEIGEVGRNRRRDLQGNCCLVSSAVEARVC